MPKTIANATVDRLLHHAHVVITTGGSIRLPKQPEAKESGHCPTDPPGTSIGHQRAFLMATSGQSH